MRDKITDIGLNFERKRGFSMMNYCTAGQIKEALHYFLPEDGTEVLIRRTFEHKTYTHGLNCKFTSLQCLTRCSARILSSSQITDVGLTCGCESV